MNLDSSIDLAHFARTCEGYTGADLKALLYNAQLEAIHELTGCDLYWVLLLMLLWLLFSVFFVICWPGVLYIQLFVKLFRGREGEMLVGGGGEGWGGGACM